MSGPRRRYDSPVRRQRMAETRDRIVAAGAELTHEFPDWDLRELTFRAVGERAGVSERTVYRHFPTERRLHDAVMQRLEEQAGVDYEAVDLANVREVAERFFASLPSFAAHERPLDRYDPTMVDADARRQDALRRAVREAVPHWSDRHQARVAGLLDVAWSMPSYERLVRTWRLPDDEATEALTWLMQLVLRAVADEDAPSAPSRQGGSR